MCPVIWASAYMHVSDTCRVMCLVRWASAYMHVSANHHVCILSIYLVCEAVSDLAAKYSSKVVACVRKAKGEQGTVSNR